MNFILLKDTLIYHDPGLLNSFWLSHLRTPDLSQTAILLLCVFFSLLKKYGLAPTSEHHVPVQCTSWAKGSTSDKQPNHQKPDFISQNENCPHRTISTKVLRMSWSAVLLICFSSQSSPGIHSCLVRLSESTCENITLERDGGDFQKIINKEIKRAFTQVIDLGSSTPPQTGYMQ